MYDEKHLTTIDEKRVRRHSRGSNSGFGSYQSDTRSAASDEENPGKLEEDARFPMEHHLMQEGPSPRLQELDALKATSTNSSEDKANGKRFTLITAISDYIVEATSISSLLRTDSTFASVVDGSSSDIWWLDCHNPTDSEISALARTFDMHPLTTEDILTHDSLEKFEIFKKYVFVSYKTFQTHPETGELEPVRFYLILFRGGVLSFHFGPEVPHTSRVRNRMRQLRDWVKVSPVWICYALLDDITDGFVPVLSAIETEAAFVEHAVFVDNGTSEIALLLGRLGQARQKTMSLVRFLYGKPDVIRSFIKSVEERSEGNVSGELHLYLQDIRNRLDTMKENLLSYESILSRCHNSYMGILQVEYVNSNTRMTTMLGKVTIIGTVLIPINLVFGAWGMNVPVPGQESTGLGWFFGIVGVICAICVLIFIASWYYFKQVQHTKRASSLC